MACSGRGNKYKFLLMKRAISYLREYNLVNRVGTELKQDPVHPDASTAQTHSKTRKTMPVLSGRCVAKAMEKQ